MKTFHRILANSMVAFVTNNFVWFAVTFWVFLETKSVIATSVMAGVFTLTVAFSGFFLGSLVDRYPKKRVMLLSSFVSLVLYAIASFVFITAPSEALKDASSVQLWIFIILALIGAIFGNLRGIAISTLVTILVPEDERDKANGLVRTATGVAFLGASIFSGLAVGYLGMFWGLVIAIVMSLLVIVHLATLTIPDLPKRIRHSHDDEPEHEHEYPHEGVDVRGTIRSIRMVPGLFGLIFFHTFNNFLGGIFMSLMDAYGLLLVSVQAWGILWGVLSLGFIIGGIVVARKGLGKNPLRTLFLANIAMWSICSVFTLQASIVLLAIGMFVWLCLIPAVEAAEQTVLQKVVEPERQGRVFGFAQSVEQAASPITAFLIGPIAQLIFIPFMTTGAGVDLIGPWFGTGTARGIALLFTVAGIVGLTVTLIAMRSNAYRVLSERYESEAKEPEMAEPSIA
jgi:DHA3 family multidrug efflux protein-like MFS transporter